MIDPSEVVQTAGGKVSITATDFERYVLEDREQITGQKSRSDHPTAARLNPKAQAVADGPAPGSDGRLQPLTMVLNLAKKAGRGIAAAGADSGGGRVCQTPRRVAKLFHSLTRCR